jgi:hypothetical protein
MQEPTVYMLKMINKKKLIAKLSNISHKIVHNDLKKYLVCSIIKIKDVILFNNIY